MSTASPLVTPATTTHNGSPRAPAMANGVPSPHDEPPLLANGNANGGHVHHQETRPAPAPPTPSSKKSKAKKGLDSNEASKLVAQRISQLELDAAGEKDQEAEIERETKKANRELQQQTARMDNIQKAEYLRQRCNELFADMKRHERESIKNKKRGDQLQKEKDNSRNELSKTVVLKEKLEKLCRELQKENNKLKNENKTMTDKDIRMQNAFDEKYSALLQQLEDYQEEKDNPRKQVVDMNLSDLFRTRFKSFMDQYDLRETTFHSLLRTKELEVQYHQARYEREKKNYEAEALRSRQLNAQVQTFSKTETELRTQLNVYVDKFKQVEDTLNNSNDLFLTFRKEMEDMSKKTRRLEKENESLKRKHDKMNQNILKMAEERDRHLKDIEDQKKSIDKLKSIITQMQQQGRGIPQGLAGTVDNCYAEGGGGGGGGEVDGEDSEYEDDEYEGDEVSEEGEEYDDDDDDDDEETEDEVHPEPQPQTYGPERPPVPVMTNGNH